MFEHNILGFNIRTNPLIPNDAILFMTSELDFQIKKAALAEALKLVSRTPEQREGK